MATLSVLSCDKCERTEPEVKVTAYALESEHLERWIADLCVDCKTSLLKDWPFQSSTRNPYASRRTPSVDTIESLPSVTDIDLETGKPYPSQ